MSEELWLEFRVGDKLAVQVGGILYASRYSAEIIEAHRAQVIAALKAMGTELVEVGGEIGVDYRERTRTGSLVALLEELSALNEAADYKGAGINGIRDVQTKCAVAFEQFLDEGRKVKAYDMVTVEIPSLVAGLRAADHRNQVLNPHEIAALDDLLYFAKVKKETLNGHNIRLRF